MNNFKKVIGIVFILFMTVGCIPDDDIAYATERHSPGITCTMPVKIMVKDVYTYSWLTKCVFDSGETCIILKSDNSASDVAMDCFEPELEERE